MPIHVFFDENLLPESQLSFACGHPDFGTAVSPAGIYEDCSECGKYYCQMCNTEDHTCCLCGKFLNHGGREWDEGTNHICVLRVSDVE